MKINYFLILAIQFFLIGCSQSRDQKSNAGSQGISQIPVSDNADQTNSFYDNEPTFELKMNALTVEGEIENPGPVDFSILPLHMVIVKEAILSGEDNHFIGAYRYDGYSLFDILNQRIPKKANQEEFAPIIDLFVIIENEQGDQVVFSWGEIYYPNHLNEILIAGSVMRIVPTKTKELWPIPEHSKVIASTDLITERNISQPSKIIVRSATRSFEVNKGMKPMFSPKVEVFSGNEPKLTISGPPSGMPTTTYETIFYGRGRGIHSTTPFGGYLLKDVLANQVKYDADNITNGILIIAAEDGYRAVFTYSEVFNRNDQAEVLLVYEPENANGGAFKLFPAGDFFSDRAIKSVNSIHFESAK